MALEASSSLFFSNYPSSVSPCRLHSFNQSLSSIRFGISISPPLLNSTLLSPTYPPAKKPVFELLSAVESLTVQEQVEISPKADKRRKLFVLNLPWSFSVADIKNLFSECGSVADVEIIKQKDGKNRGFAFVTMASGEEAQVAIEKFDSYEVVGRIIRVQFAKRFKKPARTVAAAPPSRETNHKLYISNLAWKVRSNNLRDFFLPDFNPVSARVVFGGPSGNSAGYGFVSFATKEEAESAISVFDGKELLGRPVRLKFSERNDDASESKEESSSGESKAESSSERREEAGGQQPEGS